MTTNMVYLPLDWNAFCCWTGNRKLIGHGVLDEGFALHQLLSSVFGKSVLQPFRLFHPSRAPTATLYAYSDQGQDDLRDLAGVVGPPDCLNVLKVGELLTKPMPKHFREGQRLGFDVRVRPIRRLGHDLRDSQSGRVLRKGREIDAYRLELLHRSPNGWRNAGERAGKSGISREYVYLNWLSERLADVAHVDERNCRIGDFRRSRALRGDGKGPEGPDATLHGECVIRDPTGFAARLRKGVGRHRAYGYGMLIVRPPGTAPRSS